MTDQRRPDLLTAVGAVLDSQQKARDEAAAPEREAQEQQAKADARLYGTAGWDVIGTRRQQQAAAYAARVVEGGGDDAA